MEHHLDMASQEQIKLWKRFVSAVDAKEGVLYEVRTKYSPLNGLICTGTLLRKENVRSVPFDEDRPYITHCVGTVHMEVNGEVRVINMALHEFFLPSCDEPVHGTPSVPAQDLR